MTASVTITTQSAVAPENYLHVKNNLSEIADAGAEAQEKARGNLGLGKLATADALTASEAGAVPVADETPVAGTKLDNVTDPGQYFQNVTGRVTLALNYPEAVAGVLVVYRTGVEEGECCQVYMPYNSMVEYRRYAFGNPLVFSALKEY